MSGLLFHIKRDLVSSSWKHYRYYPWTKKEKWESGHHQMVLLTDKEGDGRKLQWQEIELWKRMLRRAQTNQWCRQRIQCRKSKRHHRYCSMIMSFFAHQNSSFATLIRSKHFLVISFLNFLHCSCGNIFFVLKLCFA